MTPIGGRGDPLVADYISGIPGGLGEIAEWTLWPPDTFALTSLVLGSTGAYRSAVSNNDHWPPRLPGGKNKLNQDEFTDRAKAWVASLNRTDTTNPIEGLLEKLADLSGKVTLDMLRDVREFMVSGSDASGRQEPSPEWDLCCVLLELHALADCAGAGLGTVGSWDWDKKKEFGPDKEARLRYHFAANTLLALRGSLSRVGRECGVVLPCFRTPQSGLTIRSLSHYLSFHSTEVSIRWRSVPWVNSAQDTMNTLFVPWPFRIRPRWFRPRRRADRPSSCLFAFDPEGDLESPVERVIASLKEAQKRTGRIHLVALPELALTPEELSQLKERLLDNDDEMPDEVPMILSGVRSSTPDQRNDHRLTAHIQHGNEIALSYFFCGKWYDLRQHKHHRWRMDRNQIKQYGLAGVLNPRRSWWEAIWIRPRSLSFLAPNGWLTLCPLICEDLAQLDPVSDVIRGVGPTFVIAVLMDGPQLESRWSGRYASVLADDPGSSVLTVTALGMAERSKPAGKQRSRSVGLWRDKSEGWHRLELEGNEGAIVLTLTADWSEEHTADQRTDGKAASILQFESTNEIPFGDANAHKRDSLSSAGRPSNSTASRLHARESDLQELTVVTYFLNVVFGARPNFRQEIEDVLLASKHVACPWTEEPWVSIRSELIEEIFPSHDVDEVDLESQAELRYGVCRIGDFFAAVDALRQRERELDYRLAAMRVANEWLSNEGNEPRERIKDRPDKLASEDRSRVEVAVPRAVLTEIHNRIVAKPSRSSIEQSDAEFLELLEDSLHATAGMTKRIYT